MPQPVRWRRTPGALGRSVWQQTEMRRRLRRFTAMLMVVAAWGMKERAEELRVRRRVLERQIIEVEERERRRWRTAVAQLYFQGIWWLATGLPAPETAVIEAAQSWPEREELGAWVAWAEGLIGNGEPIPSRGAMAEEGWRGTRGS